MGFVYNPDNQDDQELRDRFVIRTKEFERIIRDLKNSATSTSAQQFLLEGQRGTGKTSLLLRIKLEVISEESLSHLLPVQFAEEQYGIFNLCGLWEKVAEELEETEGFESLLDTLDEQAGETDYELQCFDTLEHYLIKHDKKLLLLMDNFGDILNKFTLTEQQRLRDIFHNSPYIQLIAASATALEHTYQHDKPFYEFFKIVHLSGLNKEDTYTLLRKLAEIHGVESKIDNILEHQQHRVESIRRLTGGVPRTIVLLYEIFMDESGGVFEDLENILDRVTPLYKHRMDDLSTQQQVIVNALALNWDGMSTKELTDKIKDKNFTSKKISSQLQQLQKNGLVLAKAIDQKNKIYFIQERFFNIWYLMRFGRKRNKQNVHWLVSFLSEWCNTAELHQRAKKHIEAARKGELHPKGYLMAESMGYLIYDSKLQHELIFETRESLKTKVSDINLKLSPSDKEAWEEATLANDNNNFRQAIRLYKLLADKGYSAAIYNLGYLYQHKLKDSDLAILYYKMAIEKGYTDAMNNLGDLYHSELKDFDQAIYYYKMAIGKNNENAMNNLGNLYYNELKDFDQAIIYYEMAIEKDHSGAMNSLGNLYQSKLKDFDQAILYYKMASERGNTHSMNNLAWLNYIHNKKSLESLDLSKQSYNDDKNNPYLIHTHATVLLWNNKVQDSVEKAKEYLSYPDNYLIFIDDVSDYFIFLLAKKQTETAYQLFKDTPDLEQQIKPVYYATLTLLKEQYPKEYLKMGSELEETVGEILQKVKEKAERYN